MRGKYFDNWYVSEQTYFLTKMSNPTNKKLAGLERVTEKEKEEKVRKQGYTIPTIEDVNFVLRFETLDMPIFGKESSYNFNLGRLRQYKDRLLFSKYPHLT